MKRFGILFLVFVLFLSILPIQNVEAKGNTSIKKIKLLEKGEEYRYDTDGDGEKDTIYWISKKENNSVFTMSVYVNEESIYSQKAVDFMSGSEKSSVM